MPTLALLLCGPIGEQHNSFGGLIWQVTKLLLGTGHPLGHESLPRVISKRINGLVKDLPLRYGSKRHQCSSFRVEVDDRYLVSGQQTTIVHQFVRFYGLVQLCSLLEIEALIVRTIATLLLALQAQKFYLAAPSAGRRIPAWQPVSITSAKASGARAPVPESGSIFNMAKSF